MAERKPWHRRKGETTTAYAAFQKYLEHGSIDAAYVASSGHPLGDGKRAPRRWAQWSADYKWVSRAADYADHLAEQNRQLWEQRRRELQERDWEQADALRDVIERAIPHAEQFIQRRTHRVGDETIITLAFDIDALARVLVQASKLQRLATGDSTDNIQLSGAALDSFIAGQLARLAYGGEASPGAPVEPDDAETNGGAEPDAGALPG